MKKFRNASNYHEVSEEAGVKFGRSYENVEVLTKPGLEYGLRDIVERQRRGEIIPVLDARYEEDRTEFEDQWPDVSKLSKTEVAQLALDLKDFIVDTRGALAAYQERQRTEKSGEIIIDETKKKEDGQ